MIDFRTVDEWRIGNNEVVRAALNGVTVWEHKKLSPFYVENITSETETLKIRKKGTYNQYQYAPTITIEYSLDKSTWSTLGTTGTTDLTYTLQPGERIYLRASTNAWSVSHVSGSYTDVYYNQIYGVSKVGGNIMSLLYGSNFTGCETSFPDGTNTTYVFASILSRETPVDLGLIDAGELVLPATTLSAYCYEGLFGNLGLLVNIPIILPATTLAEGCYKNMFNGCHSIVNAPILPATTLTTFCYYTMFYNCLSLSHIKCAATDISATNCTHHWVWRVASNGTFIKNPNMSSWSTGASGIPSGWTIQDAA